MKKNHFLLFIFCFLISCSFAQNINKTILVDGLRREYIIHLPQGFNASQKLPVIFALHGGGGTAQQSVKFFGLDAFADKNNFIIIYPNAIKKAWLIPGMSTRVKNADTAVDDVRFMNILLDTAIAYYKVDEKKVFFTGMSRGAMFSYYLADAMNTRITAIAAVCGGISQTIAKTYSFAKPISVLMINGTDDPLVKYNGGYGILNKRNEGNEDADVVPAEELLSKIVALNHCAASSQTEALPDVDANDGCTETQSIYQCNDVKIGFIKIENGGHTWAGGTQYLPKFIIGKLCKDFSASEKIFNFFMSVK